MVGGLVGKLGIVLILTVSLLSCQTYTHCDEFGCREVVETRKYLTHQGILVGLQEHLDDNWDYIEEGCEWERRKKLCNDLTKIWAGDSMKPYPEMLEFLDLHERQY